MNDPGLSNRLRQHSRRSGLMVGLSMAAAIAILVGVFVAIYAATLPWLSDIVQIQARERTPTAEPIEAPSGGGAAPVEPTPNAIVAAIQAAQSPTEPPAPPAPAPAETAAPEPTETPDDFEPTHQIANGDFINLRPNPSVQDPPVRSLAPATPLLYLDEDQQTQDNGRWMRFRTEENEEGWVREVDTVEFEE